MLSIKSFAFCGIFNIFFSFAKSQTIQSVVEQIELVNRHNTPRTEVPTTELNGLDHVKQEIQAPLEHKYYMKHKNRGVALIFNHEWFEDPKSNPLRRGTDIDQKTLKETFELLGFKVEVFKNRTLSEIRDDLQRCKCTQRSSN